MRQYGYHFNFIIPNTSEKRAAHLVFATEESIKKDYEIATQRGFKCEAIKCIGKDCKELNCQIANK
jgi:hypothetical protein